MPKENEPATPKARPRRAAAPRKLVDPIPSPPPKRKRTLQERNTTDDFEMSDARSDSDSDIDIEILSSPDKPNLKKGKSARKGKSVAHPKAAKPQGIPHSTIMEYWQEAIDKTAYDLRHK
ncbi:hypothetical protein FRC07_006291 [Ceratobasidium sp. 392]|nr:hypothetical protein FRC07_006291 [Ceratobasidium sp. 392]